MISKLRFRHVYGESHKTKYENVRPTGATCESNLVKGNSLYFGVSWFSSGGGCLALLPNDGQKKLEPVFPMIKGHSGAILDFEFYPFDDTIVATASEDTSIKLWQLPANPNDFQDDLLEPLISLDEHSKKVNLLQFNPTSAMILASCSHDNTVKVWNVQRSDQSYSISGGNDQALALEWNWNGSLIGTVWKDKFLRIIDPRSNKFAAETKCHEGPKSQKFCWMGDYSVSVGFSKDFHRQLYIWDIKNLDKPVKSMDIDQASGTLYPFYDDDCSMLYMAGKGDGNIRYYEFVDGDLHMCDSYKTTVSGRGYGFYPKRCVDVMKNELMRAIKLTDNTVEFISFIAPRKAESFQSDLFPDCNSEEPSQNADDWFNGKTAPPKKRSMQPGNISPTGRGAGKSCFIASSEDLLSLKKKIDQLERESIIKDQKIAELEMKLASLNK